MQATNIFGNKPPTAINGMLHNNMTANHSMNGVNMVFNKNNNNAQGSPNIFGQPPSTGMPNNPQYNSSGFGGFMSSNRPADTNKGIFGPSTNAQNQGIFGPKPPGTTQQTTGIFGNTQPQQTSNSTGIFGSAGQKNPLPNSQSVFNQNQQQGFFPNNNTPFNQNNHNNSPFSTNNSNSPFNNSNNSPFGNNNTQNSYGMMGNNANNGMAGNNANNGNTNIFGPLNPQMSQNAQGGVLINQNAQQQFGSQPIPTTCEMISNTNSMHHAKLILQELNRKISYHSLAGLNLHDSNIYSKVPICNLPFKQQLCSLLKNKRTITKHIEQLEKNQLNLVNLNREWSLSFSRKLACCKELALESLKNSKMIEEVREQIEQIEKHINSFIKPLYHAAQYKTGVSFIDPDQFCMQIARKILAKMVKLEQKADDLLAADINGQDDTPDSLQVVSNLGQYLEQVAGELKDLQSRYLQMKRIMSCKRLFGNLDEVLRRAREKQQDTPEYNHFKLFELLKSIQTTLVQREEALQDAERQSTKKHYSTIR